jgi:hypothetical protein
LDSLEPVSSTAGKKTAPFVAAAVDDTDRKSTAHEHTSTGHEHSSGEEEDREHSPLDHWRMKLFGLVSLPFPCH